LVIFKHPANGTTRPRDFYRRVDLIVAAWENYGAAVVGWSGGTQFERDLRIHAEHLYVHCFFSAGPRAYEYSIRLLHSSVVDTSLIPER
jgi:hypothetical protein